MNGELLLYIFFFFYNDKFNRFQCKMHFNQRFCLKMISILWSCFSRFENSVKSHIEQKQIRIFSVLFHFWVSKEFLSSSFRSLFIYNSILITAKANVCLRNSQHIFFLCCFEKRRKKKRICIDASMKNESKW